MKNENHLFILRKKISGIYFQIIRLIIIDLEINILKIWNILKIFFRININSFWFIRGIFDDVDFHTYF